MTQRLTKIEKNVLLVPLSRDEIQKKPPLIVNDFLNIGLFEAIFEVSQFKALFAWSLGKKMIIVQFMLL